MKKWIAKALIVLGLCLLVFNYSMSADFYKIEIVDYGIYVAEDISTKKTDYGTSATSECKELIKKTRKIPAQIGTTFGFRYTVEGKAKEEKVDLVVKAIIPQPGLRNPDTGKTFHELTFLKQGVKCGSIHHEFLTFEEEWDLIPGKWKLQIWQEGKKLIEETFTVYKP